MVVCVCFWVGGVGGNECVPFVKREFYKYLHLHVCPSIRLLADRDWSIFCSVFLIQTKLCTRCQTLTCHTPNITISFHSDTYSARPHSNICGMYFIKCLNRVGWVIILQHNSYLPSRKPVCVFIQCYNWIFESPNQRSFISMWNFAFTASENHGQPPPTKIYSLAKKYISCEKKKINI